MHHLFLKVLHVVLLCFALPATRVVPLTLLLDVAPPPVTTVVYLGTFADKQRRGPL